MVPGTILVVLVTLVTLVTLVRGSVMDLATLATWRLSCEGRNISVEAAVPGGVYSDLRQVTTTIPLPPVKLHGILPQDHVHGS